MAKTKVSIRKADNYESGSIHKALVECLHLLGGLDRIVRPGSRVLVKINHLSPPSPPEDVIITHPAFTKELLRMLLELNCEVTVGDDIQSKEKDGFLISGYREICTELSVKLVNLKEFGFREVSCRGRILDRTYISALALDCDFLINLPKLKTHSFMAFSGAIKNMYGVIPHGLRCRYHREYPKSDVFGEMLVDIYSSATPHLNIMDAILAMEGEGPSAGQAKEVGLILASQDGVALDALASEIIGLDPMQVSTTREAFRRGMGQAHLSDMEITGEKIKDIHVEDFKQSAIAFGLVQRNVPAFLHGFVQSQLVLMPRVDPKRCTACEECVEICPTGAARMSAEIAKIEKAGCIHCMCCHEVCRFHAIILGQKPVGKMLRRMAAFYKKIMSSFS